MRLRSVLALLMALAMLVAPPPVVGNQAMAVLPAEGHHGPGIDNGHCADLPTGQKHDKKADEQSCCVTTCMAALNPAPRGDPAPLADGLSRPGRDRFHRSFLAELPTPPPRA